MASRADMAGGKLFFPSAQEISSYLVEHPLTCAIDQRIIETVAKTYATSMIQPEHMNCGIVLAKWDASEMFGIPLSAVEDVEENLIKALTDCAASSANEKVIANCFLQRDLADQKAREVFRAYHKC